MNVATNQHPMRFSQGRAPKISPEERRRKRAKKRIPNPTLSLKQIEPWKSFHSFKSWNLLPKDHFKSKNIYFSMMFDYPTFAARYTHFQHFCHFYKKNHKHMSDPMIVKNFQMIEEQAREAYMLNQKLRWAFKRLTNRILQKKMVLKNETDPISLEVPNQCVYLYDYSTKSKFVFEAKNLLRDFQTRLLTHEELFPVPSYLRNPLTNAPLKLGQMIHVFDQIKRHGVSHWTVECYLDARYSLSLFLRDNNRKLRLHALKETLNSHYATDIILDFIEMQHDILNKNFDERTYRWALQNNKCHSMERIRSWRQLTYRFYELDITQEDHSERVKLWRINTPLLLNLCTPCLELLEVRRSFGLQKIRLLA